MMHVARELMCFTCCMPSSLHVSIYLSHLFLFPCLLLQAALAEKETILVLYSQTHPMHVYTSSLSRVHTIVCCCRLPWLRSKPS
jgi:hypothetical protein